MKCIIWDYKWSSYNVYVGKKRKDKYIDKEEIGKYLDMDSKNYRLFVLNGMSAGEKEDDIFRDVYGGFLLGKAQFIKEKLKELKIQVESDKTSYSRELHLGIEPGIIIEEVAKRFKKNPEDLIDSKTRPALEKQIAIYLIRRHTGLTNAEIGSIFKMKAQAVSKAGIKIEKLINENRRIRRQVNKLISIFEA